MKDDVKPSGNATILDVAALADVSFKTVSRVVNREPGVRESTRAKVEAAIRNLDYAPNHHARNLRAKRSRVIGLLVSNPSRNYLAELQWGAIQQCQARGYTLAAEDFQGMSASTLLRDGADGIAGVILTPPLSEDAELISDLQAARIPVVSIAPAEAYRTVDSVVIDDRAAANAMTQSLIASGHTRIAFITSPDGFEQSAQRALGFRDAADEARLSSEQAVDIPGRFTFESGRAAAAELLDGQHPPTAIFAANDDMAAGVLAEAYRRGLRVPQELAVAGFDDTPLATLISPSLTTVAQPVREMAEAAVDLLIERALDADAPPRLRTLPFRIQRRETTR